MMMINNKKLAVVLAAISLLLVMGGLAYAYRDQLPCFCGDNREQPKIIGGEKDAHGCLVAAGYSWCETEAKCLRPWEETCGVQLPEADINAVKEALAGKYQYKIEEVHLTVNKSDSSHLRGGVKFKDDKAGGIVLAAKAGNEWQIAFDGNGAIGCKEIEKYNFPADMISDCYDGDNAPGGQCSGYTPENCPAACVVCPPCAACSSISCQSEDFCRDIGFDRSWYEKIKDTLGGNGTSCKNECGNGTCQEVVCKAIGCPCAETKASCPADCPAVEPGEGRACTMEAKECPDGSYVGRSGPNCEFAPCPGEKPDAGAGIANPASVYCTEHDGRSEIRTNTDGSQSGVCIFSNGKECDEWAYLRGECRP
jgi:putative hemolysin